MRAIMESAFCVAYIICVFILSILALVKSKGSKEKLLFGLTALVLVSGDSFHLVPRIIGLNSPEGLEGFTYSLGIGKFVTSVTMTIFYVMLYHFFMMHFGKKKNTMLSVCVWVLAAIRIALCFLPQNMWTSADSPVSWGIYRNIPFVILGGLIVALFFRERKTEKQFRFIWLAIILSFAFYIPVVLWAGVSPMVGMLMLPKTVCYVYMIVCGYKALFRKKS